VIGDDQASDAAVADKYVASTAQNGHRNVVFRCQVPQAFQGMYVISSCIELGGAANPECAVMRQRLITPDCYTQASCCPDESSVFSLASLLSL
jgi:hypothetical protein